MADIFYKTGGDFSGLTPQKVVASYFNISTSTTQTFSSGAPLYIAFTASEGGTCEGAMIGLVLSGVDATIGSINVTVTLQQNTGSWGDTSSTKTLAISSILAGATYGYCTQGAGLAWTYFKFGTGTVITTDASTWRLKVTSDSASTTTTYVAASGTNYAHAVVLTATTSFSSSDNIFVANGITTTVDQTMTFGTMMLGTHSILTWENPAVSSYTFTGTKLWLSRGCSITIGTAANPIAFAQQAIWAVTTTTSRFNYMGSQSFFMRFYGEKPTYTYTKLASNASSGQKNIVTTADMSSNWTVGDTLHVYGGLTSGYGNQSRTIASMSGTTITLNSNLTATAAAGFVVSNQTRAIKCGVRISTALQMDASVVVKYSGVRTDAAVSATVYRGNAYALGEPILLEDCFLNNANATNITFNINPIDSAYVSNYASSVFQNILGTSIADYVSTLYLIMPTGSSLTFQNVYLLGNNTITAYSATISDCQFIGQTTTGSYNPATLTLVSSTITSCKFLYGVDPLKLGSVSSTFTSCTIDGGGTSGINVTGNTIDTKFVDCEFGKLYANTKDFKTGTYVCQINLDNCYGVTVTDDYLSNALIGSYIKSHDNNQVVNSHKSWFRYGRIQSTGDGLADTTVHTSGTGKFAVRYEPASSVYNLDKLSFFVPTGNIQNKTMTVGVWGKINNAAYYSGTYQLPRLTVDYDNGTTAYCQASASTDWQLLFITFTPTTTYGQITVTLSGRTDATTTDAYIYWDDFAVLYPAGVTLDLGGMDNWANALPVTPPIAIPISAYTVSNAVWEELLASHTTALTYGKTIGSNVDAQVSKALTTGKFIALK